MSEERSLPAGSDTAPLAKTAVNGAPGEGGIEVTVDEASGDDPSRSPRAKPSDAPPSSVREGARGEGAVRRPRTKMTLKIPDDEVSRPQPPPPRPPEPAAEPAPVLVTPMRIITIEPPPSVQAKAPVTAPPPPAAPRIPAVPARAPSVSDEDSWTPYQPSVADPPPAPAASPVPAPVQLRPSKQPSLPADAERSGLRTATPALARPLHPSSPPMPAAPAIEESAGVLAARPPIDSKGESAGVLAARPPIDSKGESAGVLHARPPIDSKGESAGVLAARPPIDSKGESAGVLAARPPIDSKGESAGVLPARPPIPVPPPTAPMPAAPPTEPRSDSLVDIVIVSDDLPSSAEIESTSDIEIEEDSRPTSPGAEEEPPTRKLPAPPPPEPAAVVPPVFSVPPPPPPAPFPAPLAVLPIVTPPPGPIAPTPPRVPSMPPMAAAPPPAPAPAPAPAPPSGPNIADLPPMRALAPTEPEGLEVQFEDESPVSSARTSEPEAEIGAEDLVSIESVPVPSRDILQPVAIRNETPARAFVPLAVPPSSGAIATPAPAARGSLPPPPSTAKPAAAPKGGAARVIVPSSSALAPPPMSESAPGRRKARPWWEELFNDDFIRTMAKVTDVQISKEVDYIEESLAVAKGAMLLDLACGTGRHAIELTRRGYKVVGFDLSLPMLAKAAEEAQERGQKLNFVQGDMREMTFEDTFDGIYSWNTSFGFFEEDKNAQVVQRVHKALKKGGQFVLEVGNRDFIIRQAPSLAWFEGDGCICMDEMSIDWITSRMKVKRTMMMDDGRTKEIDYSVRVYSLHELGKILHDAGFRVAEVSGRTATPGVFFGNESPKTMILAEKK